MGMHKASDSVGPLQYGKGDTLIQKLHHRNFCDLYFNSIGFVARRFQILRAGFITYKTNTQKAPTFICCHYCHRLHTVTLTHYPELPVSRCQDALMWRGWFHSAYTGCDSGGIVIFQGCTSRRWRYTDWPQKENLRKLTHIPFVLERMVHSTGFTV